MQFISYEEFGAKLIRSAVTPERVRAAVAGVAGDVIEVGPITAGPGGAARVNARGEIGRIEVSTDGGDPLSFTATVPVELRLDVRLAATRHRYRGTIGVPLHLTVHTAEPLAIVIDVDEIDPRDISVKLSASGARARVLQRIGGVDDEVRRQVARVVNDRLESPEALEVRRIDVLALIDDAWET